LFESLEFNGGLVGCKDQLLSGLMQVVEDMKEGDCFSVQNIKAIRPGLGLSAKYLDIFIGKKSNKALKKGTPLSWELIS